MNDKLKFLTASAIMTAVLCILGPVSVPIGPVPISLTSLVIYLFLFILDVRQVLAAQFVYLLLGLAGLPVFSGYTGGAQKLFGPTGGYLIGFLPMIVLAGIFMKRFAENRIVCILILEAATWVLYLLGTAWLAFSAGMTFSAALAAGVLPFILLDLGKIIVSALIGPEIRKRLLKANVL